jgi:hypothetical protein
METSVRAGQVGRLAWRRVRTREMGNMGRFPPPLQKNLSPTGLLPTFAGIKFPIPFAALAYFAGYVQMVINYHLPDFFFLFDLHRTLLEKLRLYPGMFYDNFRIASVFGAFPNAIWNGGRVMLGYVNQTAIKNTIEYFNKRNIPCRFTWTNSALEEKHLHDTFCNMIMKFADNGMNEVTVNSPLLESYIRDKYKGFKLISSTTKCLGGMEELNREFAKDYYLIVLNFNLNNQFDLLKSIARPDKCELLANAICQPHCPRRKEHFDYMSICQLNFNDQDQDHLYDDCQYQRVYEPEKRACYISYEDIVTKYLPLGFNNFKIDGRNIPRNYVEQQFLHYMVKPQFRKSGSLEWISF